MDCTIISIIIIILSVCLIMFFTYNQRKITEGLTGTGKSFLYGGAIGAISKYHENMKIGKEICTKKDPLGFFDSNGNCYKCPLGMDRSYSSVEKQTLDPAAPDRSPARSTAESR